MIRVLWSLARILLPTVAIAGRSSGAATTGPDWPQLRGGPGFTGVSPDDSVKPPLKLIWSYRCDDGKVYAFRQK